MSLKSNALCLLALVSVLGSAHAAQGGDVQETLVAGCDMSLAKKPNEAPSLWSNDSGDGWLIRVDASNAPRLVFTRDCKKAMSVFNSLPIERKKRVLYSLSKPRLVALTKSKMFRWVSAILNDPQKNYSSCESLRVGNNSFSDAVETLSAPILKLRHSVDLSQPDEPEFKKLESLFRQVGEVCN